MTQKNEKQIAQQIKNNYTPKTKEQTKLEELKAMDKKVKNPARVFAYTFGTVGSLILGTGMCLAMKIIGNLMPLGIGVGLVGIAMVSLNYTIYHAILNKRKAKYANQIIEKSNELLND